MTRILDLWRSFLAWLHPVAIHPFRAKIAYVDPSGNGWARPPNWLDADAEDIGQHDSMKGEMRFALWRYATGKHVAGTYNSQDAGCPSGYTALRQCGPLFPLGVDLAADCRKIGAGRLMRAACSGLTSTIYAGEWLAGFHAANESEALVTAAEQVARNVATAATWPENRGPFTYETAEQIMLLRTLGPLDAFADLPPLRTYAACPPPAPASVTAFRA